MEMPKPTEHHRKLRAFVGQWTGEEKFHPMPWAPKGGAATSETNARLDLDGFFLVSDYVQKRGGEVTHRGHGVFGYDLQKQKYTMRWFDVTGFDPGVPALGTWVGNTLCLLHEHHMGHGRFTYTFERDGLYTFKVEKSEDGKNWTPFLEGTYKRTT